MEREMLGKESLSSTQWHKICWGKEKATTGEDYRGSIIFRRELDIC